MTKLHHEIKKLWDWKTMEYRTGQWVTEYDKDEIKTSIQFTFGTSTATNWWTNSTGVR